MLRFLLLFAAIALAIYNWTAGSQGAPGEIASRATVADLRREPGRFDGRLVAVSGLVGRRLTFAGYGGFELVGPEHGDALFVATSRSPAETGSTTQVTGRFMTVLTAGDVSVSVIQETSR